MQLTNDHQDFFGDKPICKVTIDYIEKSLPRGRPPVEEPVNDPKKPPVKEPDGPSEKPSIPKVPPTKKPWDIPPPPPVEEPPPKDPNEAPPQPPTRRVVKNRLNVSNGRKTKLRAPLKAV